MPTISHVVEHIINSRPLLQEAILEDIVSFAGLAEKIAPEIEKELGKKVSHMAVVMALRRYAERIKEKSAVEGKKGRKEFTLRGDITLKTCICDIGVLKSPSLSAKLKKIYSLMDYRQGDILNVVEGNREVAIITNDRHVKSIKEILKGEKIVNMQPSLNLVNIDFSKGYLEVRGVIAMITRRLSWEGINIIEIVSTYKELSFVLTQKDAVKAYSMLQDMIKA